MLECFQGHVPIQITITIPDGLDPARQALEDLAVGAYRAHRLTGSQFRRFLGIPSRYELEGFLKKRGVWLEYTLEDFRREGEITAPLLVRRRKESGARTAEPVTRFE